MHSHFRLTNAHRFHKNRVVTSCFTEHYRFTCFAGHTAQRTSRGRRTDKGIVLHRQFFHTGFIAQNTTLTALTTGIDSQNSQLLTLTYQAHSQRFDGGTLSCSGYTGNTPTLRFSGIRQTSFNNLVGNFLMRRQSTFYQGNCLTEHHFISCQNTIYIFVHRILMTTDFLAIRVYDRQTLNTFVDS